MAFSIDHESRSFDVSSRAVFFRLSFVEFNSSAVLSLLDGRLHVPSLPTRQAVFIFGWHGVICGVLSVQMSVTPKVTRNANGLTGDETVTLLRKRLFTVVTVSELHDWVAHCDCPEK
jgi:hypothetical protein